ncbi:MAG: hypothetical protein AB1505_17630 [Candidatus Latescibacterota bacterium]
MATALCRSLRTKRDQVPALRDPAQMQRDRLLNPCYCVRTLHAVGPDDGMVGPGVCVARRTCYQTASRRGAGG